MLGAAGGIGQPLSLLLKNSPLIGELSLYDVANTAGVACDISHISTAAKVKGYTGPGQLQEALHGCQLVIIPAGEQQQAAAVLVPWGGGRMSMHALPQHCSYGWLFQNCMHPANALVTSRTSGSTQGV